MCSDGAVHLDARGGRDVGSGDRAGTLLAEVHHGRLVEVGGDSTRALRLRISSVTVLLHARRPVVNSWRAPSMR